MVGMLFDGFKVQWAVTFARRTGKSHPALRRTFSPGLQGQGTTGLLAWRRGAGRGFSERLSVNHQKFSLVAENVKGRSLLPSRPLPHTKSGPLVLFLPPNRRHLMRGGRRSASRDRAFCFPPLVCRQIFTVLTLDPPQEGLSH